MALAMDLGSDGNSGYHAGERYFKLDWDQWNDQNHGACCDWNLAPGDVNARALMILNCVKWNLPHGPRKGEDLRLLQWRMCLAVAYGKLPEELPLFGPHSARILESIEALGEKLPGVEPLELEILAWLKQNARLKTGGRRTHLSRFCAGPYALVKANKSWGIDEFEITYGCLEFDFLASRKLIQLIDEKKAAALAAKEEGAPMAAPCADEQVVRGVSRNAPVVAFQMVGVL